MLDKVDAAAQGIAEDAARAVVRLNTVTSGASALGDRAIWCPWHLIRMKASCGAVKSSGGAFPGAM